MSRIPPLDRDDALPETREEWDRQVAAHGRMTNMKRTLARSPLALRVYMEWYPLRDRVEAFLGKRATLLFTHAISAETDCLICSTYFRRNLIDAGEDPDRLVLDETERALVELGRRIARDANGVPDDLYRAVERHRTPEDMVTLVAFAGLMIATNVFNNVLHVDLDDYLAPYRAKENP
jgi:alkylhydroperoxidase family enzyme